MFEIFFYSFILHLKFSYIFRKKAVTSPVAVYLFRVLVVVVRSLLNFWMAIIVFVCSCARGSISSEYSVIYLLYQKVSSSSANPSVYVEFLEVA